MHSIVIDKPALKVIRKFPDALKKRLDEELDKLEKDPHIGKLLGPPFRKLGIRTRPFHYKRSEYRIAYYIHEEEKEVFILWVDSRENFYKKLKRRLGL